MPTPSSVCTDDISWGAYGDFEGPYFRGRHPYVLPEIPTEDDRILAVITATEGGAYDAINMYDGQILSITLIQVTERGFYTASAALGYAIERDGSLVAHLAPALEESKVNLWRSGWGWRLHLSGSPDPIDSVVVQERVMLGGPGLKGSWGAKDSRQRWGAKLWAASIANFWAQPSAQRAQVAFIMPRLREYAYYGSRRVVLEAEKLKTPESLAFVAAYLSFAVNNPRRAAKHLGIAMSRAASPIYSRDWLIEVLRELTFGPGISLYPYRYRAIRPVLEKLYQIDLPDLAEDLRRWNQLNGSYFSSVLEVQAALTDLGYNLGPDGKDNVYGRMTRAAVRQFEESEGLNPDGSLDSATAKVLREVWEKRAG